jgi:hypothetical protein
MPRRRKSEVFWITNISKNIVSLPDLALHIQPMISINLLDNKHYHFTKEQVIKSSQSGSIFAKRNKVIVRQVAPGEKKKDIVPLQENAIFPTKQRSAVEVEKIKYEELEVSDEEYADDHSDTAEIDHIGKWSDK